jgi:hypothetical protein
MLTTVINGYLTDGGKLSMVGYNDRTLYFGGRFILSALLLLNLFGIFYHNIMLPVSGHT